MSDSVVIYGTPEEMATEAVERFITFSNGMIAATGTCVVALTGGRVVNLLFALMGEDVYRERIDWENILFLWAEERFVSHADEASRYGRAKAALFGKLSGACHVYPVPVDGCTVEEAALDYDAEVKNVLRGCAKRHPDLLIGGIGDDGHVAGLFARSASLRETAFAVTAVTDGKIWDRVTMTIPFLSTVPTVWFLVAGESKRAAAARVLRQREDYEDEHWESRIDRVLPAAVLPQDVHWFIDAAATGDEAKWIRNT